MFAGNPTEDGATLLEDHTFNITYRTPETAESHSQPLLSCCVLACCSANPNDPNQRKFDLTSKQYTQQGALRTVDSKEVKGSSNRKVTRDQVPTPRTTWPCPPRGHTPSPLPVSTARAGAFAAGLSWARFEFTGLTASADQERDHHIHPNHRHRAANDGPAARRAIRDDAAILQRHMPRRVRAALVQKG